MNNLDEDSPMHSTEIVHRPYSSRNDVAMESLLDAPNKSSKRSIKMKRSLNNVSDTKSLWSIFSTSMYLFGRRQRKYKCKIVLYAIILLLVIAYFMLSFYLDIPYWIQHGYKYHLDHFKLSSSLNGEFCDSNSLHLNNNIKKIKSNNTHFELTRSRILLLSYPRSGNHLTKAMLECLLQTATYGYPKEKHDGPQQQIALKNADVKGPYIRKIHTPNGIPQEFADYDEWGLIYLIRDPIECILSENKYVPYFWKDYEYQFGNAFMKLVHFYDQWKGDASKVLIFYEDFFNNKHGINLRKLAEYFGENRVSNERIDHCIEHYHEITQSGLKSLDRGATSHTNLHFYRDKYYPQNNNDGLVMKVPSPLYRNVFKRYDNIKEC